MDWHHFKEVITLKIDVFDTHMAIDLIDSQFHN